MFNYGVRETNYPPTTMSLAVYNIVTQSIIDRLTQAIESGETVAPWCKPWNGENGAPTSGSSGKPYRGINRFILSLSPYSNKYWFTLNQVVKLGGRVKFEEMKRSTPVVLWNRVKKIDKATGEEKTISMIRFFSVYNYEQCTNLPAKYEAKGEEVIDFEPIEAAESIVNGWADKPAIVHNGTQAFYHPSTDTVTMPARETFKSEGGYYSTLFHELIHSTGHAKRLNREEMGKGSFGSELYSKEELTAEMGAAILATMCGITTTQENSISYLKGWLTKLKNEPKWLVSAAGHAQKAVDMITGYKWSEETATDEE